LSRIETIGNATLYLGDCREILPALPVAALIGLGFVLGRYL